MLCPAKVFSPEEQFREYTIIVGGIKFSGKELANISIAKSIAAPGLHGIVTSCLTFDVITDAEFDEETEIITKIGIDLPTFYLSAASKRGNTVSITAYDRCNALGRVFDSSGMIDDYDYGGAMIVAKIANQCGFAESSPSSMAVVRKADVEGKSCRNILEEIAKADMSIAFCRADNSIGFAPAESDNGGITIYEDKSEALEVSAKRTIGLLQIENDKTSEVFSLGSGDPMRAYCMSGIFMTQDICNEISQRFFDKGGTLKYTAWSCSKAEIDSNVDVGGGVYYGNKHYRVLDIRISCGAYAIYAALSAPNYEMSLSDYTDKITRKVNNKIEVGKKYGCTRINKNKGYTLVDNDAEQKEYSLISLGDGLFQNGKTGDIECKLDCIGTDTSQPCKTVYDYGKYTVTVGWTENEKGIRTDPWFRRDYKKVGDDNGANT